jgi:uncharacterized protein YbaP (TraB family)
MHVPFSIPRASVLLPLFAFLFSSGALAADRAAEEVTKCRGIDMLEEARTQRPELYARIMAQAEATENSGAVLWKVEREGTPASYLFGTVHLTDERVTTLSPAVKSALEDSSTIALEVSDLTEKATTSVLAKSAPLVMYTDGRRLDRQLSASEYEVVKGIIKRSGMPADLAAQFKPWIITLIMSVSDCERAKVQAGGRVLDMQIAEYGKQHDMQVLGLETIPEQLQSLADVPEGQQLNMLRASLKFADRTDDMMETLVQLYLKRKIAAAMPFQIAMARQMGIGDDAFATFQQKVLIERNEKMAARAEPLFEKGGLFVAVGALHLSGQLGLVALLRNAGYTVTAIE